MLACEKICKAVFQESQSKRGEAAKSSSEKANREEAMGESNNGPLYQELPFVRTGLDGGGAGAEDSSQ